jgi:cytochrome c oxidase subunit III
MSTTTITPPTSSGSASENTSIWAGGNLPLGSSYGKLMMWFFLLSDAFTFSGLLVAYGMIRYAEPGPWPNPDVVFSSFPGIAHHSWPLVFVGLMTFILIMSSVTMVLGVDAGHKRDRKGVLLYMFLTILGGIAFLSCQAAEWTHMITEGATLAGNPFGPKFDPVAGAKDFDSPRAFAHLFFGITGFHGAHVTSGVIILLLVFRNVALGVYDRPGRDYEMIEKVGLYWHFVDLVWVFVFTLFYLI